MGGMASLHGECGRDLRAKKSKILLLDGLAMISPRQHSRCFSDSLTTLMYVNKAEARLKLAAWAT